MCQLDKLVSTMTVFMFLLVLEKHYYFTLSYKYINKGILTLYLKKKMMKRFLYCFRIDLAVVGAYLWEIMYSYWEVRKEL